MRWLDMPNTDSHDIITAVNDRIDRLEERRNRNLAEKMDTWERLFNVIIDTKIATVSDLLTRLQQEKNEQYSENKAKIDKAIGDLIEIRAKLNEIQIKYDNITNDVNVIKGVTREIERTEQGQEQKVLEFVEWKTRTDIDRESSADAIRSLSESVSELMKWRTTFWYKYMASGIVIVLTAVEFLQKLWEWAKSALSQ